MVILGCECGIADLYVVGTQGAAASSRPASAVRLYAQHNVGLSVREYPRQS